MRYWLHRLFDPYEWDADSGKCVCWLCKIVRWRP